MGGGGGWGLISRWILKKQGVGLYIGFFWIRTGTTGWLFSTQ
jgi:hypothetical protein